MHSDVGGGYSESESSLWIAPMTWVAREARDNLMILKDGVVEDLEARLADLDGTPLFPEEPHKSLKSFWLPAELVPKLRYDRKSGRRKLHLNLGKMRALRSGELLAPAVKTTFGRSEEWSPKNLKKAGVNHESIETLKTDQDGAVIVP